MSDGKKQGDENWRKFTADDLTAALDGTPTIIRYRDTKNQEWKTGTEKYIQKMWERSQRKYFMNVNLSGHSVLPWMKADCQVYREPAPTRSPKDGCRMLDGNEEPIPGDYINWGAGWNELGEGSFPLAVVTPSWYCRPIKKPVEEIGRNVGPEVIEAFSPVVVQPEPTTEKYREPTLADLADGPIDCEVRDNDRQKWRHAVLHGVRPDILARYKTTDTRKSHHVCGWAYCRIEVPVETIREYVASVKQEQRDALIRTQASIAAPWKPLVGEEVRFVKPDHNRYGLVGKIEDIEDIEESLNVNKQYKFVSLKRDFQRWCSLPELEKYEFDLLDPNVKNRPVPKGFRLLGDEPRLASDGYWSLRCKDWLVIGDRIEIANRDKWPAIRFVVEEPELVKHQSQDPASVFGSNPIEVRPIMQIRLPVPASVLGKLGDMLEKHYPGSTMRQVGGFLVFEEPIES